MSNLFTNDSCTVTERGFYDYRCSFDGAPVHAWGTSIEELARNVRSALESACNDSYWFEVSVDCDGIVCTAHGEAL